MTFRHPMRDIGICVFQRIEGDRGPAFIAKFEPFNLHPIFFHGATADEARNAAADFAAEAVAKNEAAYIARAEAIAKARASREAKAAR